MNTENGWIVVLIILGIVVLFNLGMFAQALNSRGRNSDTLNSIRSSFGRSFKKEDDSLNELRKRVEELKKPEEKE